FDWVYIDANHTYEGVLADLEASLPKVRPGGLICGHDYTDTPAWQAANFGVVQAVHEFCGRHQWQIICITQELQDPKSRDNPSFVLRHASLSDDVFTKSAWWRKFMP
ncbi:MAG: hypothetical protein GTO62_01975, partial [Planctomycetales bacterium]|nr:hypothetical protein [Planctomycetales bacterium]NIP68001.1 hypothetical protein [Planctomycetales bacterium]